MSETATKEPTVVETMLRQIGGWNVAATSGGRVRKLSETAVSLPVHYGYSVEVELDEALDVYVVRRVFTRGGKRTVKGELTRVYCDEVGEAVYRAGCYRDPWGGHNP